MRQYLNDFFVTLGEFHFNIFCLFRDGNQWYAWATLTFVFIPVVLSLTLGKGYKELHEAATLKKFKERKGAELKSRFPDWPDEDIEGLNKYSMPGTCGRIIIFIQTFLGFVPGLSWVPLPEKVAYSNDKHHGQTLVARKMYEFFGEDATQFLLQVKSLYIS